MARVNQTEIAILGALSIEPMTGYALREGIRDVLGHFWSESFGQIYPALAELERAGLVERAQGDRPGASVFSLTAAGLTRLEARLAEPISATPPRNGLLLRLFFGRHLGPEACKSLIRARRAEAEHQLAELAQIRAANARVPDLTGDRAYWTLTILAGEHGAQATIAWADAALAELEGLSPPTEPRKDHS